MAPPAHRDRAETPSPWSRDKTVLPHDDATSMIMADQMRRDKAPPRARSNALQAIGSRIPPDTKNAQNMTPAIPRIDVFLCCHFSPRASPDPAIVDRAPACRWRHCPPIPIAIPDPTVCDRRGDVMPRWETHPIPIPIPYTVTHPIPHQLPIPVTAL